MAEEAVGRLSAEERKTPRLLRKLREDKRSSSLQRWEVVE